MKYAFTHANIIDGRLDMEVQPEMMALVEGDKIVSVEKSGSVPAGYEKIDVSGKFLMPGLINAHVHLAGSGKPTNATEASHLVAKVDQSKIMQAVLGRMVKGNILNALNAGITTMRYRGGMR